MKHKYFVALAVVMISLILIATWRRAVLIESSYQASIPLDFSGEFDMSDLVGVYEGEASTVPSSVFALHPQKAVLGVAEPSERWVEVDLSEQKLRAWDGGSLFLETLVSTGLPGYKTPTGEFRIWIKLRATKMEGGTGRLYYYLPNVPYVMYFGNNKVPNWKGYGLHGTYWHNDFGTPRSHGCVNLPTPMAEKLYYWTSPVVPEGKTMEYASADNLGTRIIIHD